MRLLQTHYIQVFVSIEKYNLVCVYAAMLNFVIFSPEKNSFPCDNIGLHLAEAAVTNINEREKFYRQRSLVSGKK